MRTALSHPLFFTVLLACAGGSWAQTGTPSTKPPVAAAAAQPASPQPTVSANQLIERIHVEGGATQIDEVRVGGETRSITVQPKGGFPAYSVQPTTGARAWKVLGF
jgi:hypothetical protein